MIEEWKEITGHPGYWLSNLGNLKTTKERPGPMKWNEWGGWKSIRLWTNKTNHKRSYSSLMREMWRFEWIKELRDGEEAKPVNNHPGYFITSHGRMWSEKKYDWLALNPKDCGHFTISLCTDSKREVHNISRWVGEHFLDDFDEDLFVLHNDEKLPPELLHSADNLHMGTQSDNMQEMVKKGRQRK